MSAGSSTAQSLPCKSAAKRTVIFGKETVAGATLPCGTTAVPVAEAGKSWILANLSISTEKKLKIQTKLFVLFSTLFTKPVTENLYS